jgi:hypothetical protein
MLASNNLFAGKPMLIFPPFHHWPDEAAIVGRLLVDYGELEVELALSMGYAISNKRKGMRDFFKTRTARQGLIWPKNSPVHGCG